MENSVKIEGIHVKMGKEMILSNLSLNLVKGTINCIIAPNGAGKTTLFKSLVNIIPIDSGVVEVNSEPLKNRNKFNKQIFFLESSEQLFANLTVYENMMFIAKLWKQNSNLERIIDLAGVRSYKDKQVRHLSLGMKQKVLVATAISSGAEFMIFDEPLNGLDIENMENIAHLFLTLKKEGKTLLLSSHNIFETSKICDHIYFLDEGALRPAPLEYQELIEEYNKIYVGKKVALNVKV